MPQSIELFPDARRGNMLSCVIELSAVANTVTQIDIPEDARGFRIRSSALSRYNINAVPEVAVGVDGDTHLVGVADLAEGDWLVADEWDVRLIGSRRVADGQRTLSVHSATASASVYVGFF